MFLALNWLYNFKPNGLSKREFVSKYDLENVSP